MELAWQFDLCAEHLRDLEGCADDELVHHYRVDFPGVHVMQIECAVGGAICRDTDQARILPLPRRRINGAYVTSQFHIVATAKTQEQHGRSMDLRPASAVRHDSVGGLGGARTSVAALVGCPMAQRVDVPSDTSPERLRCDGLPTISVAWLRPEVRMASARKPLSARRPREL
jgi:hypothetical protein